LIIIVPKVNLSRNVTCPPKTGPKVMRLFEDAKIARKGALLHEKVPI
jgi:hypothetical protein